MRVEDAGPRIALPSWDGEGNSSGTRTGSVANRKLLMTGQFCGVGIVERGSDTDFISCRWIRILSKPFLHHLPTDQYFD